MNKKPWLIGVVLVLFVAGMTIGIWHFYFRAPEKPDFDKVGGTILVYELEKGKGDKEPDAALTTDLAQALERRLDFAWVKALDKGRVEIRIPKTGDKHADDVLRVKELVSKVGLLEFRILANNVDDDPGIKVAKDMINSRAENDAALQKELRDLQEKGLPPPGPRVIGTKEPAAFDIRLPQNQNSKVTYGWVELGPLERMLLGLDNAAEKDPARNKRWLQAKEFRGKATSLKDPSSTTGRLLLQGALFYSRECLDKNLPKEERKLKAIEYFVLARDPELDANAAENLPLEKRRTPRIDGSRISSAHSVTGQDNRPAVAFTFTAEGGDLFGSLTRKNIPSGGEDSQVKRHLAIILDGQVMSAPTINTEIRQRGQISGRFTKKEVDNLVNILRSGALPARLKPLPVSETEVSAKKG